MPSCELSSDMTAVSSLMLRSSMSVISAANAAWSKSGSVTSTMKAMPSLTPSGTQTSNAPPCGSCTVSIWPAETPGGQQISICLVGMLEGATGVWWA